MLQYTWWILYRENTTLAIYVSELKNCFPDQTRVSLQCGIPHHAHCSWYYYYQWYMLLFLFWYIGPFEVQKECIAEYFVNPNYM